MPLNRVCSGKSIFENAISNWRNIEYNTHKIFGLHMPKSCPNVPSEILSPKNTWENKLAYDKKANILAKAFNDNFIQFSDHANNEILNAAPRIK